MRDAVERAGVDALIVHARKAWLKGLSPKENRDVPPLDYERVYRLKRDPRLPIVLNGGIAGLPRRPRTLIAVDGVMMGRAAYQEPWRLLAVDPFLFGDDPPFASPQTPPRRSSPISSASLQPAPDCTPLRGTYTACSRASPARGRSAASLRVLRGPRKPARSY